MTGLWIAMAVLAAAVSVSVLAPLYRSSNRGRSERAQALAIYRDQLDEVDRDRARGLIGEAEGAAARTEIARRLLRTAGRPAEDAGAGAEVPRRLAAAAIVAMPLAALGVYLVVGSPETPAEPLAARLAAPVERQDVPTLVGRIEAHLAANPDDGKGWEVLAPVYMRLGRFDDGAKAYGNAVRLLGSTVEREADFGEALVTANDGVVSAEARAAFLRAARLDPAAVRPRFYLALGLGQEGKTDAAIGAWTALLDGAPESLPWVAVARAELAKLKGGAAAPPGPSEADVKAAGEMTPADRLAMIEGMVASLAARLEDNPADGDGWARLVRSYMVLDRPDDARAALAKARTALAGDAAALAGVNDAAMAAGVPQ